jgi:hypothetical protein
MRRLCMTPSGERSGLWPRRAWARRVRTRYLQSRRPSVSDRHAGFAQLAALSLSALLWPRWTRLIGEIWASRTFHEWTSVEISEASRLMKKDFSSNKGRSSKSAPNGPPRPGADVNGQSRRELYEKEWRELFWLQNAYGRGPRPVPSKKSPSSKWEEHPC